MATQEEIQQVAEPTGVPTDFKVDFTPVDRKNLTV
jgi:hypothetical protein